MMMLCCSDFSGCDHAVVSLKCFDFSKITKHVNGQNYMSFITKKTIIKNRSSNRTCNQSEDILFVPLRKSGPKLTVYSDCCPRIDINDINNDGVNIRSLRMSDTVNKDDDVRKDFE